MSAPHQLTEAQRQRLLTGHSTFSRREMVRHWFLSTEDLKRIQQRRREHNRLGYAVQLCLLRYPGWPLRTGEPVPPNLLHYVGQQLGADAAEFAEYAQRDNTRQEHQQLLIQEYRFRPYGTAHVPLLRRHLESEALLTDSAFTLVQLALEWLRERRVILPALATLEALVRSVRSQVEREVYGRLFDRLKESQRAELDKWLELGPSRGSLLGWLRRVPRACSPAGILDLLHRLHRVRDAGIPCRITEGIAVNRMDQLAARGARHSVAHFRRFPAEKRYSIMAAFLLHVAEELTDRSLDFHRRLIGRLFRGAENKQWKEFVEQGPDVNEKLHNYARLTSVITRARKEHRPVEDAIAEAFAWEALEQDGQEAAHLARPVGETSLQAFRTQFPQFRQYTPKFLEAFQFEAIPAYQPLLKALDTLREMNRQTRTEIPAHAPRSFVKAKWAPFVFTENGIDRCYYELCALSELSWGLKSGDVWVCGSRRYRKFDHYLMESAAWAQRKEKLLAQAEPSLDGEAYLQGRTELLDQQLQKVAALMRQHLLPEARLEGTRLVLSPLTRSGPEQAEKWAEKLYTLLPRISLTQLLEEVDNWTQFTKSFTHLYTGQPIADRPGLLTAILADATNLGKTRMAEATEKYTADRLSWIEDWYIRPANYSQALATLIKRQGEVPLASQWGSGRTSSSDGQAFPIAFRKPVLAQTNAKYGRDPVVMFYTHVSDRYTPFHGQAISSTVRDATYVLDGLLHHQTDLEIEEHYTDTSGYTDHIFALCHLLGFRFAPRIRNLADHRLFSFEMPSQYASLKPLLGGRIHVRSIREHWEEIARLVTSLRQGIVSPSLLVSKLAGHPRQNHLFVALREIGRIERSLFTLEWLQNPDLRRRVTIGLNKGEAHHTLKRAIRFYRRGAVSDRTQLDQDLAAMALNLVVAAVVLWNTAYLDHALQQIQEEGMAVPEEYLSHVSPLGWEHITLTGTYHWKGVGRAWGHFQPLRRNALELLKAKSA
jgi:TnpA family transposase